jgi:hypothetical protein
MVDGWLLHLVEHGRERCLEPQPFLDLIGCHVGVLADFQKARYVMLTNELDESLGTFSPVFGESFKVFEGGRDARLAEQIHRILGVLVEVGVEDPVVLEVGRRRY